MNRTLKLISASFLLATIIPVLAQTSAPHPDSSKRSKAATQSSSADAALGQKVFDENCSRCHNPPQSIPPQIVATLIRHMRVRASLSAADERALLRFMNP
ncbi:MAG TPA: cytochrome c [Terracidiphilus sp.]|nr:cytochrome c [Terracidiphilus sp.]